MESELQKGYLHPITAMIRDIITIFGELGFTVGEGPELETEQYNFDALNVPAQHPSRDMQDTFWLKPKSAGSLLRTHTTSVTARELTAFTGAPIRKIFPGKVFRNEATDATHEAQFYQLDAVYVDRDVSLAHLKGTLDYFFKKLLGNDIEIRFRPSYFPFTEPSIEVDIKFKGKWLEVMGGGMLHPQVMQVAGIDHKAWRGFAFGGGIDRLVMIKHGIDDVRLLYNGDLRLVNQF
ncbi:MAG: phenylalanine--tRNA ligase subunit alpha [Candidatus Pacebacteria bacterium]|jgi:phenylalanyl-tRNA synthetase alpha chain|nr:phenylalanine--tRNA ligase subunit alpha [Candidatus Paceibacterota bacterium]